MRDSPLKLNEVRVGLRFNRPREERLAEPRDPPLSQQLGRICAGIATAPSAAVENALHEINSPADLEALHARFPTSDKGYSVYFSPEDVLC